MTSAGLTRKELEHNLLLQLSQVLSREQYEQTAESLGQLSDDAFLRFIESPDGNAAPKKKSLDAAKQYINERYSNSGFKSAFDSLPITFVSEAKNKELFLEIEKTNPTDFISITRAVDLQLIALWQDANSFKIENEHTYIPSDIFFAGTIPLLDCIIEVDERGAFEDRDGAVVTSRVVVFPDYLERIKKAGEDSFITVGAVMNNYEGQYGMVMPIVITKGFDLIVTTGDIYYRNMTPDMRGLISSKHTVGQFIKTCTSFLETWYGIQIALLHPTVKSIFNQPKYIKSASLRKPSDSERKYRVKYVKRHSLDPTELDALAYGDSSDEPFDSSKKKTRYALIWYVIGHWRTFKDGRKTFVTPYWKGALRKIKTDITAREREIAIE